MDQQNRPRSVDIDDNDPQTPTLRFVHNCFLAVVAAENHARQMERSRQEAHAICHQKYVSLTESEKLRASYWEALQHERGMHQACQKALNNERMQHQACQEALSSERQQHKKCIDVLDRTFKEAFQSAKMVEDLTNELAMATEATAGSNHLLPRTLPDPEVAGDEHDLSSKTIP